MSETGVNLNGVLEWLVNCKALQTRQMLSIQQSPSGSATRFIAELRDGLVLARLAAKLNDGGGQTGPNSAEEVSLRPILEIQKSRNIGVFIRACRETGVEVRFRPDELTSDEVEVGVVPKRKLLEDVLGTLFEVSRTLEKSQKGVKGFGEPPNADQLLQLFRVK